ncbi:MAG: HEAT repeat domain-containing protein [Bacteroidales bacterium]
MVIKRSAGREIQALLNELREADEVRREAAIARLSVIGTRAVDRLIGLLGEPMASSDTKVAALRALESIGDARALPPAISLLAGTQADIALAAVGVLRTFMGSKHAGEVLESLIALALDAGRPESARLAALDAVGETGTQSLGPVWERLRDDPSLAVQRRAARETGETDPLAEIDAAAAGVLPTEAAALVALVGRAGGEAALPTLHRLLERVLAREQEERAADLRAEWLDARGAIHLALAARGSRVALYDLRDTVERASSPLPASFLAALATLGDVPSLDAVASAYVRAKERSGSATDQDSAANWRRQLAEVFDAVARREGVGRRHAAIKRIESKWPGAVDPLVSRLSRSTPASKRASGT